MHDDEVNCPHCDGTMAVTARAAVKRELDDWDAVEWIEYRCLRCGRRWRDELTTGKTTLLTGKRGARRGEERPPGE